MGVSKKTGLLNTFFGFLGGNTESWRQRKRSNRICRIEELENRELLTVSAFDFHEIRNQYADLNLSANVSDYNIIEIIAAELSAKTLKTALDTAAKTTQNDLIVVRTALYNAVIDLGNTTFSINIDSARFGSVAIVALGNEKLQMTCDSSYGVVAVVKGNVAFGGIVLNSTNNTLNIDNVLRTASSVQLVTSQFVKTVEKKGIADNYSYSAGVTYADTGLLNPLSAGSSIGWKTYEIDIQVGGTVYAYLTGLSLNDKNAIINNPTDFLNNLNDLDPYDAEKTMIGDSSMCWAASTANMLAYTGWGKVNGFQTEDDIFAYFTDHFTNNGGHQFYANEWFLTGKYVPQSNSFSSNSWSKQKTPGAGGGFYPSVQYSSIAGNVNLTSVNALTDAVNKLKDGCAVGLGTTSHALTLWGIVYDTSKTGSPQYYVSLFQTDSDDNKYSNPNGLYAPNTLRNDTITWMGSYYSVYLAAYRISTKLSEFTWLAPFVPPKEFCSTEMADASVSLSWQVRAGATGYLIQWYKLDDPSNVLSQSINNRNTTTAIISSLESGATYVFQIYTVCGTYKSIQSSTLTIKTTPSNYNSHDWNTLVNQGLDPLNNATWSPFGDEHRLTELRVPNSNLTGVLDLSDCEWLTYLDCSNNQLAGLNLSGCAALEELYCDGNTLVFSTLLLPANYSGIADFGTQELVSIPNSLIQKAVLNLSSEWLDGRTRYIWYYAADDTLVNPDHYKETNGHFIFTGLEPNAVIYCTLTNSTGFPGLTLKTTPVAITIALSTANPVKPIVTKKATITSITLSWTLPASNRDYVAANYSIICRTHPEMTISSNWITVTGKKAVAVIEGLVPNQKYKFFLQAINANGKTATVSLTASTKKFTAVTWLRVNGNQKTFSSITLSSSMPAIAKKTDGFSVTVSRGAVKIGTLIIADIAPNLKENVVFKPAEGYTGKELTLTAFTLNRNSSGTTTKFNITVEGLSASKKYSFSVRATAGEFASPAAKISGSTKQYTAVTRAQSIAKTDATVTLSWQASKFIETTGYVITWLQDGEEKYRTVDKNTWQVKIIDLSPSTRYTFTIRAVIKEEDVVVQQSLGAKISVTTNL